MEPSRRATTREIGIRSWVALTLLAVAVLIRMRQFGNPVIQIDEQFYLLVGDRMLHGGALPYVDIWDRKPIGLFLIYAAIRLLGGDGILAYQIVATLFAAATAFVIAVLARRFAAPLGATVCAMAYLLWLQILDGDGGQSPVFFDLLTAGAALIVLRQVEAGRSGARLTAAGCGAMLLVGLGMQVKYTAVFEGVYFGAVLTWLSRRRDPPGRMALNLVVWVGAALLPTALAAAWYWRLGAFPAFFDANFVSIFRREEPDAASTTGRLLGMVAILAPILAAGVVGLIGAVRQRVTGAWFVAGWLAVACGGVLIFGSYYDHYALPILVPASVALASLWRHGAAARGMVVALLVAAAAAGWLVVAKHVRQRGDGTEVRRIAARIGHAPPGCLHVFSGDPILYQLTGACFVTRYVFPSHLNHLKERKAVGDPVAELAAVFRARPRFVVTTRPAENDENPAAVAFVDAQLAVDYRLVLTEPWGKRHRQLLLERRNDPTALRASIP